MKITIKKTPSVKPSIEVINVSDLGFTNEEWESLTDDGKQSEIYDFINSDDSLANEHFRFSIDILNEE